MDTNLYYKVQVPCKYLIVNDPDVDATLSTKQKETKGAGTANGQREESTRRRKAWRWTVERKQSLHTLR
ncbi:hypothetical protein K0M31_015565, partial [Melipona bicolor]